ncbi:MAG: peptide deformylase [Verrucomicrobia bacterium]|nr:peptide deformylase [Verrucomicrobiota bacterium]
MILPIVKYGHPALRQRGARIETITPQITQLIADMFETMYDSHGLGLAAQQVGQSLQLTILDVRGVKNRPSTLEVNGQPADVEGRMPLVLINPELEPIAESVEGTEGCLSFPEIFADISRPEAIEVRALNEQGQPVVFRCGGLLARAIQHEKDHLQGILFIDRMPKETRRELQPQLDELQAATKAALKAE